MEKDCPEFVFNIRGSDVKDQINNICPSIWQCHFSSIGKIFIRSTEFNKNVSQSCKNNFRNNLFVKVIKNMFVTKIEILR